MYVRNSFLTWAPDTATRKQLHGTTTIAQNTIRNAFTVGASSSVQYSLSNIQQMH